MEQKQVKIIGFRAENSGIIKAVTLTPDLLAKRLVVLVGESGQGKSTLINLLQTAVSGTDAIKSKSILEKGYLTEAMLMDGDIKLYVGAKVSEYQRGANKGEPKFEIFLYAKDDNGTQYTPIIDGVKATAGEYVKLLTTDLTFNMSALFSSNQVEHRKLIEKLFKPELQELKADEVVARIVEAKRVRDEYRILCQSKGAYMERFEDEGYTEASLNQLKSSDIKGIEDEIFKLQLEKGQIESGVSSEINLQKEKIKAERMAALQKIKDEGILIKDKITTLKEENRVRYEKLKEEYDYLIKARLNLIEQFSTAKTLIEELFHTSRRKGEILTILEAEKEDQLNQVNPVEPTLEPIPVSLSDDLSRKYDEYETLEATPLPDPIIKQLDVSSIVKEIQILEEAKKSALLNNDLLDRFSLWKQWIEAKGVYEKEIDTLRKMYASIDTGVKGMHIVPVETESDRVEVWVKYDGNYDPAFFVNQEGESRFIFEYSSFQCSAIGVMLQAARLNLKSKALRLAIVDDVAFTSKGLAVLAKMCEDFNVQLITAKTDDYDKENIPDGEVIVENGEVFFNI